MVHFILLTIISKVKNFWDKWDIQGGILFSLELQILLIMVAPFRKSARYSFGIRLIWFAYVLADAVPNYVLGLIANSQRNQANKPEAEQKGDMFAFWAPFLLLHMGGPDTITAFALEDNELWSRHFLNFGVQAVAVIYMFIQSFPNENLCIPTLLMVFAGIIKYIERIRALHLASLDKFRDSVLRKPDPGPNYVKLMMESAFKSGQHPKGIMSALEFESDDEDKFFATATADTEGKFNSLKVVHYARHFRLFTIIFTDLILPVGECDESRDFFRKRSAKDALKVMEVELNFLYELMYTKFVVYSRPWCLFRLLAFGSVLATLGIFHFKTNKDEYCGADIRITYALLLGAIALDLITFLGIIFSDWIGSHINPYQTSRICPISLFNTFFALKELRWHRCKCAEADEHQHHLLDTPLVFRRWSGSISGHNFIRYCLKSTKKRIHEIPSLYEIMSEKMYRNGVVQKVNGSLSFNCRPMKEKLSKIWWSFFQYITHPVKDTVDEVLYVSQEPLTKELWEFIFEEIKTKSEFAGTNTMEAARTVFSARGELALTTESDRDRSKILKYVSDFRYDSSILIWHIATDLCYHTTTDEEKLKLGPEGFKHRQMCKILSDYMLYLLVFQPTLLFRLSGKRTTFLDTHAGAEMLFAGGRLGPNQDKEACEEILSMNTYVEPMTTKGNLSRSVLFDASILAKELKRMENEEGEDKWMLMSKVWVELLSYGAVHCNGTAHAAQISKGGELVTFVWLLMAHFGIRDEFESVRT